MHPSRFSKKTLGAAAAALAAGLAVLAYHRNETPAAPQAAGSGPRTDLFPRKAGLKYARGFSIRYAPRYKVVEIVDPFKAAPDTARYVLVPRGEPRPAGFAGAMRVEIPVRRLVCLSTTHIALTDFLGANDRIVGISDTGRVLNPDVLRRIREGGIAEVGRDQTLNQELVLSLAPDLLMTVGFPGRETAMFGPLLESGMAVVTNSEWMETSPLGRLEWVKLLAAFLDNEGLAEAKFDSIEREYGRVKRIAEGAGRKPKVIGGIGRKGVWTVPGGRSYVAALLRDAGADYPWADDTTTGSRTLGFETVYREALQAEFWLNAGWAGNLRDIADEDVRYKDFKSFRTGKVFSNTKRMGANGSNDYWESGLVNPHRILSDLVTILHPERMPGGGLFYTQVLE